MKKSSAYTAFHIFSSIVMILALVWLTVSTPFVYAAQQEWARQQTNNNCTSGDEDSNPFANTTEEKTPGPNTLNEEYLHDTDEHPYVQDYKLTHNNHHSFDIYIAFHGELISPPPDVIPS